MVSHTVRKMTGRHWLAFFAAILVAWSLLYMMAVPDELRQFSKIYGAEFWIALCTVTPDAAGFGRIFLMWVLMSGAMMAPTALPAFATYEELGHNVETTFWKLVAGYLVVWVGYSFIAAGVQLALFSGGLISALGDSQSTLLSIALLSLAGIYQFSPLKEACLSKCRQPLTFFMQYFDEGPWRNGLRLGLVCLGCCWALMLLAFVGGVMNLAFMALATVIMVLEKMPDIGRYITRPLGVVLLGWAASLVFLNFF